MTLRIASQGLFFLAAAATAFAQANGVRAVLSPAPLPPGAAVTAFANVTTMGPRLEGVTGQPFSAQQESQTVQTLADGTHITSATQKVAYHRDSLGRVRTERIATQPPGFMGESSPPVFIEIQDPVAGYRYSFDSTTRTAHRFAFGPVRSANAGAPPPPGPVRNGVRMATSAVGFGISSEKIAGKPPGPETATQQLGTQNIEGVLAEGVRLTTTWPAGSVGNDKAFADVRETWTSRELGMVVLDKRSDPRSGDSTTKLTNISRSEPDPSLFQPPAGYEIVDPPGQPVLK